MGKKRLNIVSKIFLSIIIPVGIFLHIFALCAILDIIIYSVNLSNIRLEDVKNDFQPFECIENACYFDNRINNINFFNHKIDVDELELDGEFCGGVSLYVGNLYLTTKYKKNYKFFLKIFETDLYGNVKKCIFEETYNYNFNAYSYDNIIYIGGKNKNSFDVYGYDIVNNKYLGLLSSYDYYYGANVENAVYEMREKSYYDIEFKNSIITIKNRRTEITKEIDLSKDDAWNLILKQKFWSLEEHWIENNLYIVCVIETSTDFFNVVFEYNEISNKLEFKFYYVCSDLYGTLYFG